MALVRAHVRIASGCDTQAAWSRTVFPYALPTRFQFTLNQDTPSLARLNAAADQVIEPFIGILPFTTE